MSEYLGILRQPSNTELEGDQDVTYDIRQAITSLQGKGAKVEISWTPGHSSIAGNDVADRLAKQAAKEASSQPEEMRNTSLQDVRQAAEQSQTISWQSK